MSAKFRLGCVPYVNARPLVAVFDQPNPYAEVIFDVPSKLPALLNSGEVDAILVSSIELLRRPDLISVGGVGIISDGNVDSVRMLSKVPIDQIKTLALDKSSMTSNLLAQIILREQGVEPTLVIAPPNLESMLEIADACVLIGDIGMDADGTGLVDIDLGKAWTDLTGLPFVWAVWVANNDCEGALEELHEILFHALEGSGIASSATSHRREYTIQSAMENSGWSREKAENYLTHTMHYPLTDRTLLGLRTFASKLSEFMEIPNPDPAVVTSHSQDSELRSRVANLISVGSSRKEGS